MKRICYSCHIQKDIEDYPKATTPSYAQQRYNNKCKFCTNLSVHGLTYEKYQLIAQAQNNQCSLCDKSLDKVKINIDHNHDTGEVRGILCKGCNVSLGTLEKNLDTLKARLAEIEVHRNRLLKAADYLANPPYKKV